MSHYISSTVNVKRKVALRELPTFICCLHLRKLVNAIKFLSKKIIAICSELCATRCHYFMTTSLGLALASDAKIRPLRKILTEATSQT